MSQFFQTDWQREPLNASTSFLNHFSRLTVFHQIKESSVIKEFILFENFSLQKSDSTRRNLLLFFSSIKTKKMDFLNEKFMFYMRHDS